MADLKVTLVKSTIGAVPNSVVIKHFKSIDINTNDRLRITVRKASLWLTVS